MRHVCLTCKNHPDLRWSCKEIAFTDAGGYNGQRNIFFRGKSTGKMFDDMSGVECVTVWETPDGEYEHGGKRYNVAKECPCPPSDLIRAPEDKDIHVQVFKDGAWTHVPQAEA